MTSYHGWTHAPKAQGGTDPIPGATVAFEWATATVTNASLGASATAVSFSALSGDFDESVPTFELVSGNLVIGQPGLYDFTVFASGFTLASDVVSVLSLVLSVDSGSLGTWSSVTGSSAGFAAADCLLRFDESGGKDFFNTPQPSLLAHVNWGPLTFSAPTLLLEGVMQEDNVGVATSLGDFRLFARRLGSVFVNP